MSIRESSTSAQLGDKNSADHHVAEASRVSSHRPSGKGTGDTAKPKLPTDDENQHVLGTTEATASHCNSPLMDGPCHPFSWRQDGNKIADRMQPGAWRMVNDIWNCIDRSAEFVELKLRIYNDPEHPADAKQFGTLRSAANSFFKRHRIPWRVHVKSCLVSLEPSDSNRKSLRFARKIYKPTPGTVSVIRLIERGLSNEKINVRTGKSIESIRQVRSRYNNGKFRL
jgi:hypothetical protein